MDYCIKNNRNTYIKLGKCGEPVTCGEMYKGKFTELKAKNIVASLPKTLKRMNFKVIAIPDIKISEQDCIESRADYELSQEILDWVDKFGTCADIFEEAKKRKLILVDELHKKDNEIVDILHIIEIETSKDMFKSWKLYKDIRENRISRRKIKDELLIIGQVLNEINPSSMQRDKLQRVVNGLFTRKYSFKVVDDEENRNEES